MGTAYESMYKQFLHQGGSKLFRNFFKENFRLDSLKYDLYIRRYYEIWGKGNILVLPFEWFIYDKRKFLNSLLDFLNEKNNFSIIGNKYKNRGYSLISSKLAVILNRFIYNKNNKFGFIVERPFYGFFSKRMNKNIFYKTMTRISYRLSIRWFLQNIVDKIIYIKYSPLEKNKREEILSYFKDSNKKLDEFLNLDLAKYKYY